MQKRMDKQYFNRLENENAVHLGVADRYLLQRVFPFIKSDKTEQDGLNALGFNASKDATPSDIPFMYKNNVREVQALYERVPVAAKELKLQLDMGTNYRIVL
jgi:hypothetical protein